MFVKKFWGSVFKGVLPLTPATPRDSRVQCVLNMIVSERNNLQKTKNNNKIKAT